MTTAFPSGLGNVISFVDGACESSEGTGLVSTLVGDSQEESSCENDMFPEVSVQLSSERLGNVSKQSQVHPMRISTKQKMYVLQISPRVSFDQRR